MNGKYSFGRVESWPRGILAAWIPGRRRLDPWPIGPLADWTPGRRRYSSAFSDFINDAIIKPLKRVFLCRRVFSRRQKKQAITAILKRHKAAPCPLCRKRAIPGGGTLLPNQNLPKGKNYLFARMLKFW